MAGAYHEWLLWMILSLFTLVWGATVIVYGFVPTKALSFFFGPFERLGHRLEALLLSPINLHARCIGGASNNNRLVSKRSRRVAYGLTKALALAALIIVDTMNSTALDLLRIWGSGLTFTVFFLRTRARASANGLQGGEDKWGFGQGVAVFMLLLPVFGVVEIYCGKCFINGKQHSP